jgi:hypothetical protein
MDWIIWVIVIVVIVGVVWWLLNRNSSGNTTGISTSSDSGVSAPRTEQAGAGRPGSGGLAGGGAAASAEAAATTGMAAAAGFASPAGPALPTTTDDARDIAREAPAASEAETSTPETAVPAASAAVSSAPMSSAPAGGDVDDWDEDTTGATEMRTAETGQAATDRPDVPEVASEAGRAAEGVKAEWEEQWSEAASTPHAAATPAAETTVPASAPQATAEPATAAPTTSAPTAGTQTSGAQAPIHHPEYTEPHAPTLPGAESAAAEDIPATEAAASQMAEPAGHLAADKPYGEGSAAPGPDGSGPEGYTVKGNAQSMIYHDETSEAYEETIAEVWFESAAHAEAAGFRAPRRSRH